MSDPVKTRAYDARRRQAAAEETRAGILTAAHELFTTLGYDGTAVSAVAARAGVSVDTVYASVGRKPQLLLAVHDRELAAGDQPLVADQRDYVLRIRAAPTARAKIEIYAAALAERLPLTTPLALALRAAGLRDPACRAAYEGLSERRAVNMRRFADDLRATGETRPDVSVEEMATLVWSMNSPDYFQLLADRGLSSAAYADLVTRVWTSTFLTEPS